MPRVFHNPARFTLLLNPGAADERFLNVTRQILGLAKRRPDALVSDMEALILQIMADNGAPSADLLKDGYIYRHFPVGEIVRRVLG